MGQPPVRDGTGPAGQDRWGAPGELKHLSTPRKQNQQESLARETPAQLVGTPLGGEARSSGERTGPAPKPGSLRASGVGAGVVGRVQSSQGDTVWGLCVREGSGKAHRSG